MTALYDSLSSIGRPIHDFRVVRLVQDEDASVVIAYVGTDADPSDPGLPSMYIIGHWENHECSQGEMKALVDDLNDHITAHRRLVGLDVDEFARNGIK